MRDEQALLSTYRDSGDLRVLGKLYEPYMPLLFGLCYRYLQDQARSEDAVMQIFETLIDKLREHEVTHFKSWLYTLAKNHCLMELRKSAKFSTVDLNTAHEEIRELEAGYDTKVWLEHHLTQLEACMQNLSEEQHQCVRLFFLEQQCYQEVSAQTGYTLKQVKSYIQNGKRNLKRCMEQMGYGQ